MSPQEIKDLKEYLAHLSVYYQRPVPDIVLKMYVEDLQDLPFNQVRQSYDRYRRDPKNRTMPLPAQIRGMLEPQAEPENLARETVARILQAQDRFGYTWPKEAREFIGEVGWSVVQSYGGWENFCQGLGVHFSVDTFSAHARELIKGRIVHGESIGVQAQQLPYRQHQMGELEFQNHKQEQINRGMDLVKSLSTSAKTINQKEK